MYTKEQQKVYRQTHRAEHLIHVRKYRKNNLEKVKEAERLRRSTEAYKIKARIRAKKNYIPHPKVRHYKISEKELVKKRVRGAVKTALRNGSLQKSPCEVCKTEKAEAHHPDYTKPLEVIWFCRTHHVAHHKSIGSYTKKASA